MNDFIDLCSSDDEDLALTHQRTQQSYLELSDDDDDVCEIVSPVKKAKNFVTPEGPQEKDESGDEDKREQQRKPRSLFGITKAMKDPFGTSSDESSDDELLNFRALTRKKIKAPVTHKDTSASLSKENNISPKTPRPSFKTARFKSPKPPPVATAASKKSSSASSQQKVHQFFHPYANRPVESTTLFSTDEIIRYPILGHRSSSPEGQYEDLRATYILKFWKYSKTLVHASYNLGKLDQFCRRINALALSKFPIRSLEEYCQRFTTTSDASSIREALQAGGFDNITPPTERKDRCYFSIAEACLVSLLSHIQSRAKTEFLSDLKSMDEGSLESFLQAKDSWMFLSDLLPMVDSTLRETCPGRLTRSAEADNGASFYTKKSTRSAEYKQIEKLQSKQRGTDESFIKAHKKNGKVCFELTTLGFKTALWIQQRHFPSTPGHYRTSNLSQMEPRFEGVCLAVDRREGGGPKQKLHTMCNKLDTLKIPYFVCTIDIGDYCFFAGNKLLPVLIERKSIQDVAHSIYDGRWTSQKQRMYQGQFVFGYNNCSLAYIIEGKKEMQELTGGYVGQSQFNVTSKQLDEEIQKLQSEGFDVLRTQTPDHSMVELSRWAAKVLQEYRNGKFKANYTFDEFRNEVKKIPRNIDFSRIRKDMTVEHQTKFDEPIATVGTQVFQSNGNRNKDSVQVTLLGGNPQTKLIGGNKLYKGWTVAKLKEECEKAGLPKSGKKENLIERLNGPRPPQVWLERKSRGGYVPSKYNTCATALLVGLWLEQSKHGLDWKGMPKEELYALAESLDISKDPFSGLVTSHFKYDGWSSMSDLRSGEIPLIILKRGHFKLTTSCNIAGYTFAEAMHIWCHEHNNCKCHEVGYV